jgi:2-polyprenyl-3-methyl-5-hydroxy-6-metoxy-1,4-benzoquinol methylase
LTDQTTDDHSLSYEGVSPADSSILVCPRTNQVLRREGDAFISPDGRRYQVEEGILKAFVAADDSATETVQAFYEEAPFPNYNDFDTVASFIKAADRGVFARLLREQIPSGSTILEVGCGTGQLSNYLAATTFNRVYAADMTLASLRLGAKFARVNGISRVGFLQMNLFRPCIRPESADVLITNGVLHHTGNTRAAFESIVPLVKPGGYILVGLYNGIGRLRTDLRRLLYKCIGERALLMDPHLRKSLSPEKRRSWVRDQYLHPVERKHSISEVLDWFHELGISFVSSIPGILEPFGESSNIFQEKSPGTLIDRKLAEMSMLFTSYGGEGGLFIMVGRRA